MKMELESQVLDSEFGMFPIKQEPKPSPDRPGVSSSLAAHLDYYTLQQNDIAQCVMFAVDKSSAHQFQPLTIISVSLVLYLVVEPFSLKVENIFVCLFRRKWSVFR